MSPAAEKRLLQAVMAITLLLPATAAILGVTRGPGWLGHVPVVPTDLDSHFRYVSGLFLAMLCLWASCIPGVERKTARIRLLGLMVVTGGLARLASLVLVGVPSAGHLVGLGIELVETPLILLWQARIAGRFA
jgi:hypothetical protein